jgi:GDP-L-fucose synthase
VIKDEVLRSFSGKNAAVTGGTGMIGRQVVDILCATGANVRIISLDQVCVHAKAEHVFGDLTNFELCKQVTRDMDFVFHIAGVKGSAKVSRPMLASHIVPTLMFNTNVLEACRVNRVKKAVYTSSISAYADAEVFREGDNPNASPVDSGWAKRMGEIQIYAYKVQYGLENFAIVRPSNVYGPGDNFDPENAMVVASLMARIHRKEDPLVVWGDGSAIRDIVYSRDVAEGCILALYHGTKGGFVNLGSGREVSIQQLVEALRSFLTFNYSFDARKPSGWPRRVMDIALARKMIDYNPSTPLAEGLKQTWEWYLAHQEEYKLKKNYFQEQVSASAARGSCLGEKNSGE